MSLSVFDLFKIGIGPSSSHTVGPMTAARRFVNELDKEYLTEVGRITVDLFGSLAMTGLGHNTDTALILGLMGETPEAVDIHKIPAYIDEVNATEEINILRKQRIPFDPVEDLRFNRGAFLPEHSNGLIFNAFDRSGDPVLQRTYFSIGGGSVLAEEEMAETLERRAAQKPTINDLPFSFTSATQLLEIGERENLSIADIAMANELVQHDRQFVLDRLFTIWQVMDRSIAQGCEAEGKLPGSLQVARRAGKLVHELKASKSASEKKDVLAVLDWVNLFAIAVNEENAGGGRVVTAPTNGAAGVIPAVIAYYLRFVSTATSEQDQKLIVATFLLTASAIGMLFKANASISAAEVGCQGEIGVACSMAAAGLTAVLGGSNAQIENAAEIGMEHNLGLTCDPIGGLVQIPCIERNTMGAVKAINASRLALQGDGLHRVSLDSVIETMRQTGKDMQDKYKETSMGGLAVNVVNC